MVICLEQGAELHIAQLMPLPLTVFSKIQIGFTQLVPAHLNGCVCVCVRFFETQCIYQLLSVAVYRTRLLPIT